MCKEEHKSYEVFCLRVVSFRLITSQGSTCKCWTCSLRPVKNIAFPVILAFCQGVLGNRFDIAFREADVIVDEMETHSEQEARSRFRAADHVHYRRVTFR